MSDGLFTDEHYKSSIDELWALYKKAEDAIKTIERLQNEGIVIPSLNELRYAGYHLLRATSSHPPANETEDGFDEQISRARKHCKRAIYDALEVGIIDRLEAIALFQHDYRMVNISEVLSDYVDLKNRAKQAKDFIENTQKDNRDEFYDRCLEYFHELVEIADKLEAAREELNKKITRRRHQFIGWSITVVIGILGLIVSLLIYYK